MEHLANTMLPFRVKIQSGTPITEQVIYAVHKALVTGQLRAGEPFPSVRELSRELKINPNTAFKIVARLKQEGLLVVEPGRGTFLNENYQPSAASKAELLDRRIEALVIEARKLHLDKADIKKSIDEHWKKL